MRIPWSEKKARLLLGRFMMEIPVSWEISNPIFQIGPVQITETEHPSPLSYSDLWEEHLRSLRETTVGADEWKADVREEGELSRYSRYVLYHPPGGNEMVAIEALSVAGPIEVWFKQEEMADASLQSMKESIGRLAERYERFLPPYLFEGDFFYTGHGRIEVPQEEEIVEAQLSYDTLAIDFSSSTEEEKPSLLERFDKFSADPEVRGTITKVRADRREIAGVTGEEVIFYHRQPNQELVEANFQFQSASLRIQGEGKMKKIESHVAIWDEWLGSLGVSKK